MKVKELIEALSELDGNLVVYGFCDHGQTPEMVQSPTIAYVEKIQHSFDEYAGDEADAEELGYEHKVVIL